MLFAAYGDNVLESAEKSTVRDYANRLGISQKQMDLIKHETKRRYAEFQRPSR